MTRPNYTFTSESVSEGHPDKLCDRVVFEAHDLSALKRTAKALDDLGYDKFFDLVQSRRLSNKRLFNLFHYLLHPNKVDVSQVDFSKEKGYQMVVACPKGFTF